MEPLKKEEKKEEKKETVVMNDEDLAAAAFAAMTEKKKKKHHHHHHKEGTKSKEQSVCWQKQKTSQDRIHGKKQGHRDTEQEVQDPYRQHQ